MPKNGNDHNCGHDHDMEEFDTIILTDEEGKDHEFLQLDTLDVDGSTYFILMPILGEEEAESEDEDADEAIILKLGKDEQGNEMLIDIDDDEEWEKVADAWDNIGE
ncbi:MAG: DUF1292 domain-containing protein [Desulfitobacteriaceae bacterium]|nr:DUF1292 domain-containing protein [Desulfitobacteriaceae bacterium]MDD4345851.1 DUF1292 domain-containing protein [Desulfitobacteriaceae bacterium]MDD4401299.1 DUF1292 domain-containing protein [Desulfitobacteriaceae bacterium]